MIDTTFLQLLPKSTPVYNFFKNVLNNSWKLFDKNLSRNPLNTIQLCLFAIKFFFILSSICEDEYINIPSIKTVSSNWTTFILLPILVSFFVHLVWYNLCYTFKNNFSVLYHCSIGNYIVIWYIIIIHACHKTKNCLYFLSQ